MGSFKEIQGDLVSIGLTGQLDFIGHGCNCQQLMGAGIALQIKNKFPGAYKIDQDDKRLPIERLGDMTWSIGNSSRSTVINFYTQLLPGPDLNLAALTLNLFKINMLFPDKSIGLPLIGCGIAGGKWEEVKRIIQEELRDMNVIIVHYEKVV